MISIPSIWFLTVDRGHRIYRTDEMISIPSTRFLTVDHRATLRRYWIYLCLRIHYSRQMSIFIGSSDSASIYHVESLLHRVCQFEIQCYWVRHNVTKTYIWKNITLKRLKIKFRYLMLLKRNFIYYDFVCIFI